MSDGGDVLVVEDNADLAEITAYVLGQAGFAVRVAENGERALRAVAERKPALVLLDMLMPVMDGWQCAAALRAVHGYSLPIVVVSAAEDVATIREEICADDALCKPFDLRALLEVVGRYVEREDAMRGETKD